MARPARPQPFDVVLALVVAVIALIDVALESPDEPTGLAIAAALGTTVPLAWRTAAPPIAALIPTAALLLEVAFGAEDQPIVTSFAPLIGLFALGEHGSRRELLWAGVPCVLAGLSVGVIEGDAGGATFGFFATVGGITVGRAARTMTFETDVLEAKVQEQERLAQEALAQERARIARELHDVVGHSISLMGIQAGAVRRVLPQDLDRERDMLLAVERTGRDSVAEMRRLIGLLRTAEEVPDGALPTLARASQLVEEMRRAGLEIDLQTSGDLASVPPGRDLAAYRILQEALVNALKHAPGAPVRVSIRRSAGAVAIEVDSGRDPHAAAGARDAGGHGLIGMRERVALYDGDLTAQPTPDGGFRIRAFLPEESR